MKTNKLEEQSRQTRERILDAANLLFFSRGYADSSVDDICREAGVTKGAFYHHFKNKDSVYRRLFIPHLDRYLEAHYSLSDAPDARERFLKLAQCTFASSVECGRELVAQSVIGMLNDRYSQLFQEDRIHTRYLREACRAAIDEGFFPPDTQEETVVMLYSYVTSGFLVKWASATEEDDRRFDWPTQLEMAISLLVKPAAP